MKQSAQYGRFGSGQAVRRVEDESLLTGRGQFVDDHNLPGQAHLMFLRSPHAHARIVGVDTKAAAAMPGVVAVVTGADLVRGRREAAAVFRGFPPRRRLAHGCSAATGARRRHRSLRRRSRRGRRRGNAGAGARCARSDRRALRRAAVVVDASAAVAPAHRWSWPAATDNVAAEIRHGDAAAADEAFASAAHVVALDLVNQRLAPCPIEPRATVASYDTASGRITLRVSSQTPTGLRDALCGEVLGIAPDKVRVVVGDVGGGFGMKTGALSRGRRPRVLRARDRSGRSSGRAERIDEFLAASHGRDLASKAELALDARAACSRCA